MIIGFALLGALLYWLRAEFNITLSKRTPSGGVEDIDFTVGWLPTWTAVGAALGAGAAFRGGKNSSDKR
ncbi:hypothetical protein C1C97_007265 [Kocuria tytonis]|uniref:Uncharacterized protein n=1 Tax=Kocuria tytonis TaxID=2054280 RepID=A0A495A6T6_9MICC|nr:hypothetical protein C1C97_007265 [Kocuria tytonis]